MTSAASRKAIASAIGLRHAFPRQTNKTFVLAIFILGAGAPDLFLFWPNHNSNIIWNYLLTLGTSSSSIHLGNFIFAQRQGTCR